jgi:hypothetical protein
VKGDLANTTYGHGRLGIVHAREGEQKPEGFRGTHSKDEGNTNSCTSIY